MTVASSSPNALAKSLRCYWWLVLLAMLLLGLLFLASAPAGNRLNSGSTWGNGPDGYGAWYAYMQEQGVEIERWQRPIPELLENVEEKTTDSPATLLRVLPTSGSGLGQAGLYEWREQGNRLIVLAQRGPVSAASFSKQLSSKFGDVTIETRRRIEQERPEDVLLIKNSGDVESLLSDEYGAVVWRSPTDAGELILSTTSFLGANAYLDSPGNFAFLANLVQQGGGPIWVDEYLHGYKDQDVVIEEVAGTWLGYLAKTPVLIAVVQGAVVLLIVLIAQNRRLGGLRSLPEVPVNNSEAYIKALAGVLHKVNSHDFLVETLTRAEQKSLQRALGLGEAPVPLSTLQTAWQQTTGRSIDELIALQRAPRGESAMRIWLRRLQSLQVKATQGKASKQGTDTT
ncbi:MAG: DUF4350 domain-containing protein [Cyanobacteria bacterium P01_F01_bin.53]